jgi:hypothetical protein
VLAGASLLLTMIGASAWVNAVSWGSYVNFAGIFLTLVVLYNWFGDAIAESESGKYSARIDVSYRWSMSWFIFPKSCSLLLFRRIVLCPQYFHAMAGRSGSQSLMAGFRCAVG